MKLLDAYLLGLALLVFYYILTSPNDTRRQSSVRGTALETQGPYVAGLTLTGELQRVDANEIFTPTGTIVPYAGAIAPDGWHFCDGSPIPPEYTELLALLPFGTFPSFDNAIPLGKSATYPSLGSVFGKNAFPLTLDTMPTHHHELVVDTSRWSVEDDWYCFTAYHQHENSDNGGNFWRYGNVKHYDIGKYTTPTGFSAPLLVNNIAPSTVVNYIIKL